MKFYRNIKLSVKALMLNPSRTIFSVLGMAVGIAAVIVTVSIGEGAKEKALKPIRDMGANVLLINAGKANNIVGRERQLPIVSSLKPVDVEFLSEIMGVRYISPFQERSLGIKYLETSGSSLIQGVSNGFLEIKNYKLKSGQIFSDRSDINLKREVLIGSEVERIFFKNENALGKTLYINKIPFTIIGILQPKGLEAEIGNIDNVVLVPFNTAMRRLFNLDYLSKIYIGVDRMENMKAVEQEVKQVLRKNHKLNLYSKDDDFTTVNQVNAIKTSEETSASFNTLTIGVAIISLIIGGVGILALMILSVKERVNEIGLRKSIGAKNSSIILQFLSEALILGFVGGIIGVMFGIASAFLLNYATEWSTIISIKPIIVSFGFSLFTALLFGVFPAKQASSLDPIDALKTE